MTETKELSSGLEKLGIKDNCETDLDFIAYCRRAVGEWQALDPTQGYLLSMDKNVALKAEVHVHPIRTESYDSPIPQEWVIGSRNLGLRGTKLRLGELLECEVPETEGLSGPSRLLQTTSASNIKRHVFFKKFMAKMAFEDGWRKGYMKGKVSQEERIEQYWRTRLRLRSSTIVIGILESVRKLKEKGYRNWVLPTGDKIPLDSLSLASFHILSKEGLTFTEVEKYPQMGGTILGGVVCPIVIPAPTMTFKRKILASAFVPGKGFAFPQCAISVTLPGRGGRYIVDPTARVYGYKGENGGVVVAAKFKDYKKGFPGGEIVAEQPPDYKDTYWLGNGPEKFVERLCSNLEEYFDRASCNYCGIVEGTRPDGTSLNKALKFLHGNVEVDINCDKKCGVKYCGPLCMKLDEGGHKRVCN